MARALAGAGADAAIAEVRATYDRYIQDFPPALVRRFESGEPVDYEALKLFRFPLLLIQGQDVVQGDGAGSRVLIWDEATFDKNVCDAFGRAYAAGWRATKATDVKVTLAAPDLAIVEMQGSRFGADGSTFNRVEASYWLRRFDDGWRIVAGFDCPGVIPQAAEFAAWFGNVWPGAAD